MTAPLSGGQRGRFAPSPTGELHLGNARTAMLAWLWARASQGNFTLRVEDLDLPRVRPGLAQRQLAELQWLGITWDEGPDPEGGRDIGSQGPYRQSERTALYEAALARLQADGLAYDCFCSRAEIALSASAPNGPADEGPRYPGTCAQLDSAQRAERRRTRAPSVRLRVPPGEVAFEDLFAGRQRVDVAAQTGDFVLRRADGIFAYQLAVVVDDAAMRITQVLRGSDLLASTGRQLLLYRLLGLAPPRFAHAPLVLVAAAHGEPQRLAKRDRALSLSEIRARGAPPERVLGLLAQLSGLAARGANDEPPTLAAAPACTLAALVPMFDPGRVPAGPAVVGATVL